jgi:hypothetical protein
MDMFATAVLAALVRNLKRPQTFLLRKFFPLVDEQTSETIVFDVENGKRRMSPFVSPLVAGKVVQNQGYTTNSLKPAYIKDKREFKPGDSLKRMAGEQIGGNLSPEQRRQAALMKAMQDQLDMLYRRLEWMASGAMKAAKYTVSGEGYEPVEINFGRAAGQTVALTSSARWGESGVKPSANIKTWARTVLQGCGSSPTDVVMDPLACDLFMADEDVKESIKTDFRGTRSELELAPYISAGGVYKGRWGQFDIWEYQDWYVDDNDTEQKMLADYSVILGGADVQGVRHHGAIHDEEAGLQAMEFFAKSWVEKDPSLRWLLMQSAPLVVPYRTNASFGATVR